MFWYAFVVLLLLCASEIPSENLFKEYENFKVNAGLAKGILEALQDSQFEREILFDLLPETQPYINRTMSLIIKYAVKREVDKYRSKKTDAISRRLYSSLIMKLIDIAKDLPSNTTPTSRIETAHIHYNNIDIQDPKFNAIADMQVFHFFVRLYDILYTAPKIINSLGDVNYLTPRTLFNKLLLIEVKPIHLGIAMLIQYHLRRAINFAIRSNALTILATMPDEETVDTLKNIAAHMLPVSELVDLHLAHRSTAFKDTCPSTWLGIVNSKAMDD